MHMNRMTRGTNFGPAKTQTVGQASPAIGSSRVAVWTGVIYSLIGIALAGGGTWLVELGGTPFYLVAGLGILIAGGLLIARRRSALWAYAVVLFGTLAWAINEVQFDWWPLA